MLPYLYLLMRNSLMNINQDLIKNCIAGERISHKALYEQCAPYVYTIVKSYISDKNFVKDGMQEAFAHIFNSLRRYDVKKGSFKSWIGRITINQCINILKKTGKISLNEGLELIMNIPENAFEHLDSLTKEDIEMLLEKMPDGYRTIFLLSVIDGFSHKEISGMLKITPETSRSQLSRAIQWIRKNIKSMSNQFSYEAL